MKITKLQLRRIIGEAMSGWYRAVPPSSGPATGGKTDAAKEVDYSSLEIEGIDHSDYPDYVDAFFSYGSYADGIEMTDMELQTFQEDNPDLFYEKLKEFLY